MADFTIPCPIPRCALEWHLALIMVVIAVFIWVVSDTGTLAVALALDHFPRARHEWGVLIGVPGLFQVATLCTANQGLQRFAALVATLASLVFALILLNAHYLTILAGVFIVHTLSEAFVFAMLRGARWKSSKNSSAGSPGPGSLARPLS